MILRINIYFKYSTNNNIFIFIYNKFCRRIKAPLLILIGERFNFIKYISFITSFRVRVANLSVTVLYDDIAIIISPEHNFYSPAHNT